MVIFIYLFHYLSTADPMIYSFTFLKKIYKQGLCYATCFRIL